MRHRSRAANLPVRIAAGAYIVNSGLSRMRTEKEGAAELHTAVSGAYPMLEGLPPEAFAKAVGLAEVGVGGALLLPLVGDGLAGLSLAALGGALVSLYLKTPGMRVEGTFRPTEQGVASAKDVWLLGTGLSLMGHSLGARWAHRGRRAARARAKGTGDKS